ncbi:major facilitator superfamily domain-containing protein [Catenaria anguillulae PL171]|uniref:Major facilitator superfamily domain-containing protein n=1 Tax=Catenaria anguillulae PL171 TaxID=765915 RepID=A0A1Y2HMH6_9FUNG|nr:major facilitator superfamily domain-containing protein [Catenaria anguillulae PL171]
MPVSDPDSDAAIALSAPPTAVESQERDGVATAPGSNSNDSLVADKKVEPDQGGPPPSNAKPDLSAFYAIASTYLAFTIGDSALRMIVLLELFSRQYTAIELALMFSLYELLGVVTNLFGGLSASRIGLRPLLLLGLVSQVVAITMLFFLGDAWSKVVTTAYIAVSQGFSGIAKDLVKMSGKSVTKLSSSVENDNPTLLLRLVSYLTGAKNSIKGLGYFVGAALVAWGYIPALSVLMSLTLLTFLASFRYVPAHLGKSSTRLTLAKVLKAQNTNIRRLSLARIFLFGARDLWFEIPLPVFLRGVLGWSYFATGFFLAAWVMVYGGVQSSAPHLLKDVLQPKLKRSWAGYADPHSPQPLMPMHVVLVAVTCVLAGVLYATAGDKLATTLVLVVFLFVFACAFAMASALHSYLIVAYSGRDKVAANVGIYYCANAVGRLAGTLASGFIYVGWGLNACLWFSAGALVVSGMVGAVLEHPLEIGVREAEVEEGVRVPMTVRDG